MSQLRSEVMARSGHSTTSPQIAPFLDGQTALTSAITGCHSISSKERPCCLGVALPNLSCLRSVLHHATSFCMMYVSTHWTSLSFSFTSCFSIAKNTIDIHRFWVSTINNRSKPRTSNIDSSACDPALINFTGSQVRFLTQLGGTEGKIYGKTMAFSSRNTGKIDTKCALNQFGPGSNWTTWSDLVTQSTQSSTKRRYDPETVFRM